jgi:hypothetical protein
MLLGLIGSALVTLCWFGPMFLPSETTHSYGYSTAAMRAAFIGGASLLALLGLAYLPAGRMRFRLGD